MSDDALRRARQALAAVDARRTQPAAPDSGKVDDLLARARAAAASGREAPKPSPPPAQPAPAPSVEKVRLQMTCGATGRSFIAIAERRGDQLLCVGNEAPQAGHGRPAPAELLSGAYHITIADGWTCPQCGSHDSWWSCTCAEFPNALHCGGTHGRTRYCACGRREERFFGYAEHVQVRGQSIAATSGPSPARLSGPRSVPAIRGR